MRLPSEINRLIETGNFVTLYFLNARGKNWKHIYTIVNPSVEIFYGGRFDFFMLKKRYNLISFIKARKGYYNSIIIHSSVDEKLYYPAIEKLSISPRDFKYLK